MKLFSYQKIFDKLLNMIVRSDRNCGFYHHKTVLFDIFRNLAANGELAVQVATQAFMASWRAPEGDELAAMWAYMDALSPWYPQYRAMTERVIPLIAILLKDEIPVFGE